MVRIHKNWGNLNGLIMNINLNINNDALLCDSIPLNWIYNAQFKHNRAGIQYNQKVVYCMNNIIERVNELI